MSDMKQQLVPADPEFQLWRILDHTRFMIARAREKELAKFGLTPEQSHVLDILVSKGGSITINEIVAVTQRQHHSISTLVTRMVRQGLVTKKKDPDDLRKWVVSITASGERVFRDLTRDAIHRIISCLPEKNRATFKQDLLCLLKRAYEVLGLTEASIYQAEPAPVNESLLRR
jgi:DNA-binding MarR family transcriptional regulator